MPAFAGRALPFLFAAAVAAGLPAPAQAEKRTVCTITVNSPDEAETLRRRLPEGEFQFVELVERGRPDWLASACRSGVRCDMLVISGHFDSGTEFYSDRLGVRESLPVAEMERATCSESCPGVFSHLKEVYLFGCNTLNAQPIASTTPEIGRSLARAGYSPADAERMARDLDLRHGESSRDHMRRIFMNVPAIYGFSGLAPLGPTAGALLDRYFESAPPGEIGSGRPNPALVARFAGHTMTMVSGLEPGDPQAAYKSEVCRFVDDRSSPADRLHAVHDLLRGEMAEVRMYLDRIEAVYARLRDDERRTPPVERAQDGIARDLAARDRFLRFAEDADMPATRARMIRLAGQLGWLSPADERVESVRMVGDLIESRSIGPPEVELICTLNEDRALDAERHRLQPSAAQADQVGNAAALACLGSAPGRARVVEALTSRRDDDVRIAEVYLGHRPVVDVDEIRAIASGIARMPVGDAQVRALDTLARHHVSDRPSLDGLARLYATAGSPDVQRAIAGVFIRADDRALARADLARTLARYRLKSPGGKDIIDVLIRRLGVP